jgi:hypothetical protein
VLAWVRFVKSSLIPVLAVIALLVAMLAQLPPSMQSRVSVRFRIASDVAVTKYSIPALVNYGNPLAVFLRDGVLYVAYGNTSARVSRVVRADTGEVVRECPLGDYFSVRVFMVAGRGTAYGLVFYYEFAYTEWGFKIVDLWSCEVLVALESAFPYTGRFGEYLFKYDMYADRLLFMYRVYNETLNANVNYVALIDVATRDVKTVFFGICYDYAEDLFVVIPLNLQVGPDYYYILVSYYHSYYYMHIYDKNLEQAIRDVPWESYFESVFFWYGLSDVAVNAHGVLVHRIVGESFEEDRPHGYYLRLVMFDPLLSGAIEYSTDADNVPSEGLGVVAYRDLFVFHHGKSAYSVAGWSVPYAFIFLPGIGLAVNTSIAGFAVPVGYELWNGNKVVLFNPATGDLYLVDPPVVEYTITSTVTETTTTSVTYTTTETVTETITTTETVTATITETVTNTVTKTVVYTTTVTETTTTTVTETKTVTVIYTTTETVAKTVQPLPLSPLLPLLLLIAVVAVIGSARASRRAIPLGHATAFVKKKRDHS